jgi:hypothetical protein
MKEKKVLNSEVIESQTLLELPDRRLMQAGNEYTINIAVQVITIILAFLS